MLWLSLVLVVIDGIILAVLIFLVLYRAVSNLIDWVVLTFGNDNAVEAKMREINKRSRPDERSPQTRSGG